MIEQRLKEAIRDIYDFPKPGIVFKDITPILKDYQLCSDIVQMFSNQCKDLKLDAIVGIESRGFLLGLLLANHLGLPFIPIRKQGKLPADTFEQHYDLEYGSASIEIHRDAFKPGARLLVHDDLLATGGTVVAASKLIQKMGGEIAAFAFVVNLDFLKGTEKIKPFCNNIISLVSY
jgi:adenine phosphoribosyltransferase